MAATTLTNASAATASHRITNITFFEPSSPARTRGTRPPHAPPQQWLPRASFLHNLPKQSSPKLSPQAPPLHPIVTIFLNTQQQRYSGSSTTIIVSRQLPQQSLTLGPHPPQNRTITMLDLQPRATVASSFANQRPQRTATTSMLCSVPGEKGEGRKKKKRRRKGTGACSGLECRRNYGNDQLPFEL